MLKLTKEIKGLVKEAKELGFAMEDFKFETLKELIDYVYDMKKDVKRNGVYAESKEEEKEITAKIFDILEKIKDAATEEYSTKSLKEYVDMYAYLFENATSDTIEKLIREAKQEMEEVDKELEAQLEKTDRAKHSHLKAVANTDKVSISEVVWKKISYMLNSLISKVAKDEVFIDETLVPSIRVIMKNAGIEDEEVFDYLEACEKKSEREDYIKNVTMDILRVKKTKKVKSLEIASVDDGEEEDDEHIKRSARNAAREDGDIDRRLGSENKSKVSINKGKEASAEDVEAELSGKAKPKTKVKKILLAIVKKVEDGEIKEGIIGETDLTKEEILKLDKESKVLTAIDNAQKFNFENYNEKVRKLKGTEVYLYNQDNADAGDDAFTVDKF